MRARARHKHSHPRVVFQRRTPRTLTANKMAAAAVDEPRAHPAMSSSGQSSVPSLHASRPPIRDNLETETSSLQDETVDECLPFLLGEEDLGWRNDHGIPHLDRGRHIKFLHKQLGQLPGPFKAADSSRPWIFYWCLHALTLLGEDVASYRQRLIETVRPMQNLTGGFGGGFGQTSHLATTYATVLALALVGGDAAYEVVDRRSMWRWLSSLKQPDGGFQMCVGGEEDVRGAYCAAVTISLLNLPLDLPSDSPACAAGHTGLFSGLGEWIRRSQTYEGGVSAKSGFEAHGAYAFCALGCLSIIDSPHRSIPGYLDLQRLISWLSSRQYCPEGGFSGRTNKLVDGCYSHWVGGCWPLIEASLSGPQEGFAADSAAVGEAEPESLFSRAALIRYIMCCCQDLSKRGGLRDKPSKYSDAYHTCYVLAGLSSAQHKWTLASARPEAQVLGTDQWVATPYMRGEQIFDESDRVCTTHPVYVIPQHKVESILDYFASKAGF
ncbi:Protein farnesyltransferase subunit beta-like protein [Hapsidospora chrysogenum ATCC 11550]|uniref:Protein farnesyltransferase subunit beta n=2 Tax=Hapsidospora chrysogena TaxID=5044 RepID=A0A086SVV0_HAPC1|nr:Protein farnesyltransferase subunit beta-like protein [Hapsidospora chrysogenum ATCC 11550]